MKSSKNKKKTKSKKSTDLIPLILFCLVFILKLFIDSFYIYGKPALICSILKNIIFIGAMIYFIYYHYIKYKEPLYTMIIALMFCLVPTIYFSIENINCFYGLFSESKVLITDNYYLSYSSSGSRYSLQKYYLKLKNGEEVHIHKSLYDELDNNNPKIKITYWKKTGIADQIELID